jgi:hypothetical protein
MPDQGVEVTEERTDSADRFGQPRPLLRRVAAGIIASTLVALIACDLWVGAFRSWWDRHSVTGSAVSSLLVVGVSALIFDEVVARRQRKQRAVTVAVQGLIVYGQTRRTYDAVVAATGHEHAADDDQIIGAGDELRILASMLLMATPSLFDDPVARLFLSDVQRLAASMYRALSPASASSPTPASGPNGDGRMRTERSQVEATIKPLAERIPAHYRAGLEERSDPTAVPL